MLYTVFNVFLNSLKLFAPVAPFIAESMYQNMRHELKLKEESVHLLEWPKHSEEMIDKELEQAMQAASEIVQSALAVREKIQLGVRWPVKELVIAVKDEKTASFVEKLKEVIKKQVNAKEIALVKSMPNVKLKIKADYSQIGPDF